MACCYPIKLCRVIAAVPGFVRCNSSGPILITGKQHPVYSFIQSFPKNSLSLKENVLKTLWEKKEVKYSFIKGSVRLT